MPDSAKELLVAFELHSPERIEAALAAGIDIAAPLDGKLPLHWLLEMYTRSDRFPRCLSLLLERGAQLESELLGAVLLDDPLAVAAALRREPDALDRRLDLISAYTPLLGASPLHVAAEYGSLRACRALIEAGAEVNARAAVNEDGLNGHTPIFHAVNAYDPRSDEILQQLIEAGAHCDLLLPGIIWGHGFDWETTCFDVTPISYAQLGLLPQMHRQEQGIYRNIRRMLAASGRPQPALENVPNKYLCS